MCVVRLRRPVSHLVIVFMRVTMRMHVTGVRCAVARRDAHVFHPIPGRNRERGVA